MKIKKFENIIEKSDFNLDEISYNNIEYCLYGKNNKDEYWRLMTFKNIDDAINYYNTKIQKEDDYFIYGIKSYVDIRLIKETKNYELLDLDLLNNSKKYNL